VDPTTAGAPELERLLEPLRADPGATGVLCDVDGTLAPITADPGATEVPEPTRETLRRMASTYALVGCVTGRRALEARRIVGVDELVYAGNHGFELLRPGAERPTEDPAVGSRAGRTKEFVAGLDQGRLASAELHIEDKGSIQALHWRRAGSQEVARMQAQEVAKLAQAAGLVPRWGRKVLELRPVAGIDKGSATMRLLREAGVAHAIFGGDDLTDIDAFQALRWMRSSDRLRTAVCVGVSSDEAPDDLAAYSDVIVDGTDGFAEVLEALTR
jgi:trehalose 6-phosphate phosphatase